MNIYIYIHICNARDGRDHFYKKKKKENNTPVVLTEVTEVFQLK